MSNRVKEGEARGRLTAEEAARLSDQIAGLSKAGRPLGPGLLALAEELPHGRFRRSLVDLAESLGRGESLDSAMDAQKDRIPPHLRGLVLGGIRSGRLGDVLGRFSGYVSIGTELARKLWLSLAYPVLSIFVAVGLFLFVSVVLVAQFESIFKDFGIPLPKMTIAMIMLSHALRSFWPAFVILVVAVAAFWLFGRLSCGRRCGVAWPRRSRWWGACGDTPPGPSSATCSPCSWRRTCPCPRRSG